MVLPEVQRRKLRPCDPPEVSKLCSGKLRNGFCIRWQVTFTPPSELGSFSGACVVRVSELGLDHLSNNTWKLENSSSTPQITLPGKMKTYRVIYDCEELDRHSRSSKLGRDGWIMRLGVGWTS